MAEEVQISGGPEIAKVRNVWAVALLPYITFGIYFLVWYFKINREMADLGRKRGEPELGDSPVMSLVAITFGAIIIVPAILSYINTYKRIRLTQTLLGVEEPRQLNGWIVLIGYLLLPPLAYGMQQSGLNAAWPLGVGAGAPPPVAPPAPEAPAPPAPPAV